MEYKQPQVDGGMRTLKTMMQMKMMIKEEDDYDVVGNGHHVGMIAMNVLWCISKLEDEDEYEYSMGFGDGDNDGVYEEDE